MMKILGEFKRPFLSGLGLFVVFAVVATYEATQDPAYPLDWNWRQILAFHLTMMLWVWACVSLGLAFVIRWWRRRGGQVKQ